MYILAIYAHKEAGRFECLRNISLQQARAGPCKSLLHTLLFFPLKYSARSLMACRDVADDSFISLMTSCAQIGTQKRSQKIVLKMHEPMHCTLYPHPSSPDDCQAQCMLCKGTCPALWQRHRAAPPTPRPLAQQDCTPPGRSCCVH